MMKKFLANKNIKISLKFYNSIKKACKSFYINGLQAFNPGIKKSLASISGS